MTLRKALLLSITFLISTNTFAQLTEADKLYSLCKVWGFLKYHHPKVAQGKFDWDAELFIKLDEVKPLKTKEEVSNLYIQWIYSLGKVKEVKKPKMYSEKQYVEKVDLTWLQNKNIFTDSLITVLNYVYANRNQGKNVYTKIKGGLFEYEPAYKDTLYPGEKLRMLALFRYWNVIAYYNPHKKLMDINWDSTLVDFIPVFKNATDTFGYYGALRQLSARTNDSHSWFEYNSYERSFRGVFYPPAIAQIINDKAIVTRVFNDSLAKANDIQYGDVILKIDGKTIDDIRKENEKYVPMSTPAGFARDFSHRLLNGNTDTMQLVVVRNGMVATKTVRRYLPDDIFKKTGRYKSIADTAKTPWYIRPDSIGYINLALLKTKDANKAFRQLRHTKGLIFDLRNYPQWSHRIICRKICNSSNIFMRWAYHDEYNPGSFITENPDNFFERWTVKCGYKRKEPYYKNKIAVLVNEVTGSLGEIHAMAYETAPNSVIMGSQTLGAGGGTTQIPLPGGILARFAIAGFYYPNFDQIQRKGVNIDIEVSPTVDGIRAHKDEVLDRAVEYINTGK